MITLSGYIKIILEINLHRCSLIHKSLMLPLINKVMKSTSLCLIKIRIVFTYKLLRFLSIVQLLKIKLIHKSFNKIAHAKKENYFNAHNMPVKLLVVKIICVNALISKNSALFLYNVKKTALKFLIHFK
jgi:hypothetical protein